MEDIQLVDTVTTYTGNTPQTGDTYALANGATGFAAINTDGEVDVDTVSDADYPSVSRSYIKLEILYCMQGVGHELTGKEIDFMEDMYSKLYT